MLYGLDVFDALFPFAIHAYLSCDGKQKPEASKYVPVRLSGRSSAAPGTTGQFLFQSYGLRRKAAVASSTVSLMSLGKCSVVNSGRVSFCIGNLQ